MRVDTLTNLELRAFHTLYTGVANVTLVRCALEASLARRLLFQIDRELHARGVNP